MRVGFAVILAVCLMDGKYACGQCIDESPMPPLVPATTWTAWYSVDDPSDGADDESLPAVRALYPDVCATPTQADCRVRFLNTDYATAGQTLASGGCDPTGGLWCQDVDQTGPARCLDYEVRFLCPTPADAQPEPHFHWDMSTKASVDADEPVTCEGAVSSIYPNAGGLTGTVGGALTATDSFDSSDHLCAVRNQKAGWVEYGSANDRCISEPACCTSGLTVTFWMRNRTPVSMGYISIILSTGGHASKARGIVLYLGDYMAFDVRGFPLATQAFRLNVMGYYPSGQWTHHSFTFEPAVGTKFYMNGTFIDSTSQTVTEGTGTSQFDDVVMFSRNNNPSGWPYDEIDGDFSNFKVFYKNFNNTEVQNAYLQETTESSLLIHYLRRHSHEDSFGVELECLAKAGSPPAIVWHRSVDGARFESVSPSVDVAIYETSPTSYRRRSVLVVRHLALSSDVIFACEAVDTVRGGSVSKIITIPKRVMFWTPWLSADSPVDGDDRETLVQHRQSYDVLCKYPSDIQCRTVYGGLPSNETGQILNINCTLSSGLECLGADQGAEHGNSCFDYEVRYQCPEPFYRWTPWYDASDPDGTAEDETFETHVLQAYPDLCTLPIGAECRLKVGQQDPIASGVVPEVPYLCNARGFRCRHADNAGSCPDVEVRYRCPDATAAYMAIDYVRALHSPSDVTVRLECRATTGQATPAGFSLEWAWLDPPRFWEAVPFSAGSSVDISVNASRPDHRSSVLTIVDFAYTEYSGKTLACLARDGIALAVGTIQPLFGRPEPILLEFWKLGEDPGSDPSPCSSLSNGTFPSAIGHRASRVVGHVTYVDAPALADHACAVLSDTGSALDLGTFVGQCVSSPDLCAGGLTLTLWVMAFDPAKMASDWFLLSSGGHSQTAHGIAFYQSAADLSYRLQLRTSTRYFGEAVVANDDVTKDTWVHLALVFDHNDGIKVYIDGDLSAESRDFQTEVKTDGEVNLVVGAATTSSGFSKAAFSDLRVYAGALTQAQLTYVMTCNSVNVSLEITEVRQVGLPADVGSPLTFECRARGIPGPILAWELRGVPPGSPPPSAEQTAANVTECVTRSTLRVYPNPAEPESESLAAVACRAESAGRELERDLEVVVYRAPGSVPPPTASHTQQPVGDVITEQPVGDVITEPPVGDVITETPTRTGGEPGARDEGTNPTGTVGAPPGDQGADGGVSTGTPSPPPPPGGRVTPDPMTVTTAHGEATVAPASTPRAEAGGATLDPGDPEMPGSGEATRPPTDIDGDDKFIEETPGRKAKSKLTWLVPVGVCVVLLGIPTAFVLYYICKKKNNSVHDWASLVATKPVKAPKPASVKRYRGAAPVAPPKATPVPTPTQEAMRMVDVQEVSEQFDPNESMENGM